jgi:hypothetical protein
LGAGLAGQLIKHESGTLGALGGKQRCERVAPLGGFLGIGVGV